MKKKILLLLLVATSMMGQVRAQNVGATTASARDSVVHQATFYFQSGIGDWIQKSDYTTMDRLLRWAKSNATTPIEITGWADKSGIEAINEQLSLRRARAISNYLVRKGIAKERITFKGQGVDTQADSDDKARRADVRGGIRLVVTMESQPEPKEATPIVAPQSAEEKVAQPVAAAQPKQEVAAAEPTAEPTQNQPATQQTLVQSTTSPTPTQSANNLRWYAGIGGGVSLGVSTLSSFAPKGCAGWQVGVLGGYRISPLLSAEVGITFGQLKLGASTCCEDYFLGADGVRYLAHVAGMDSYSYRDIYSSVSMQQYALRLNVDMLQIANADWDKRWSLTLSPAIYGINTTATLKTDNATIIKRHSQFQSGAGAGIGVGYQINRNLGVGVRSGAVWIFGDRYDGIAPTDHKENMIWNTTVTLTWRF